MSGHISPSRAFGRAAFYAGNGIANIIVPERSVKVSNAMDMAATYAQEDSRLTAAPEACKAVFWSVVNTVLYAGKGVTQGAKATITFGKEGGCFGRFRGTTIHIKLALKTLASYEIDAVRSLIGVALGVVYVVAGLVFPFPSIYKVCSPKTGLSRDDQEEVKARDTRLLEFQQQLKSANVEIESQRKQIQENSTALDNKLKELKGQEAVVGALLEANDQYHSKVAELQQQLEDAQLAHTKALEQQATLHAAALKAKDLELEETLTQLQNNLNTQNLEIDRLKLEIADIGEYDKYIERAHSKLQRRLEAIKGVPFTSAAGVCFSWNKKFLSYELWKDKKKAFLQSSSLIV